MTREHARRISSSELGQAFGFTEREELFSRVTNRRFEKLIDDERTIIHAMEEGTNSYGDFLFVTASRRVGEKRAAVVFYGLGFHEHRERWYVDEWAWYEANLFPQRLEQTIPKDEAKERIEQQRAAIASYVTNQPQSTRAKLFEMLADLTDEDGALAELEDLGDVAGWLLDDQR